LNLKAPIFVHGAAGKKAIVLFELDHPGRHERGRHPADILQLQIGRTRTEDDQLHSEKGGDQCAVWRQAPIPTGNSRRFLWQLVIAIMLVNGGRFKEVRYFFEKMVRRINPSFVNIVFVSLCAGIGEEVLFRAGIQPMIGIWWASILFVMLHGYIHPSNLHLTIYGCFLIVICSGFGYLFKIFGLTASVVAHFIYDVSMFSALKYSFRSHPQS